MVLNIVDLASYFDAHDVSPDGWPVLCNVVAPNQTALEAVPSWPAAALPSSGRVGSGRGLTHSEALESGLGSAIELACACRWPDLETTRANVSELEGEVWDAAMLSGFSRSQLDKPTAWNTAFAGVDNIRIPESETHEWVRGLSVDGQTVWLPADVVYISDAPHGTYVIADTNGCAAGETDKAARSAALFELIERDATGRWWYGKRARRRLTSTTLGLGVAACVTACSDAGIDLQLVDITSDLDVPCVAAVGKSSAEYVACGFAAAARFEEAATKAVTEMAQMFLVIRGGMAGAVIRPGLSQWLSEVTMRTPPLSLIKTSKNRIPEAPQSIGSRLTDAGVRIAFVNISRSEFGVPVWRAVSPDLCHWKPRFGRDRLLMPDWHDHAPPDVTPNSVFLRL